MKSPSLVGVNLKYKSQFIFKTQQSKVFRSFIVWGYMLVVTVGWVSQRIFVLLLLFLYYFFWKNKTKQKAKNVSIVALKCLIFYFFVSQRATFHTQTSDCWANRGHCVFRHDRAVVCCAVGKVLRWRQSQRCCCVVVGGRRTRLMNYHHYKLVLFESITHNCVFVYTSCCFVALTAPEKKEYQTIQAASEKVLAELKRLAAIYAEKSKEIEQLRKELSRIVFFSFFIIFVLNQSY